MHCCYAKVETFESFALYRQHKLMNPASTDISTDQHQSTATVGNISAIKGFSDNYFWKITSGNRAVVVDPGDAAVVIANLEKNQQQLSAILITHHHADHIGGVKALKQKYHCKVYGPAKEASDVVECQLVEADNITPEGLSCEFNILDVPGHTLGHISYYCAELKALFCGDTLFAGGCGRIFEGTAAQMYHSLAKLAKLPADSRIYCAHEYTLNNLNFAISVEPNNNALQQRLAAVKVSVANNIPTVPSLLAEELATNPFLRVEYAEIINSAKLFSTSVNRTSVDTFAAIRAMKDNF